MNDKDLSKIKAYLQDPAYSYIHLEPDEDIAMIIRHHWMGFLTMFFVILAMILVPVVLFIFAEVANRSILANYDHLSIIVISSYMLFVLTFILGEWINFYFDIVFITNKRIINVNQVGLLSRQISELSMGQVENVSAQTYGFLENMFNTGRLVIETAGEGTSDDPRRGSAGYFSIDFVPDANNVARKISELHRLYKEVEEP